ncbi:hypothetical protein F4861DRAFT_535876 [Xylaria intraflava]|nr:hypothetical protein F4861DRAFT_535876 [Xylaria intraflava]
MAPAPDSPSVPDDPSAPHYSGASPLDGGSSPSSLGGGDTKFSPSGLEIGLIVGVAALVLISLIWVFFWRSRRHQANKQTQSPSAVPALQANDAELTDASGQRSSDSAPKDDRASTADNDEVASIEQPSGPQQLPMMLRIPLRSQFQENRAEEHEITTRV